MIGSIIADMVRGGPEVSEFTVQRFFALHAVILPLLFVPLLVASSLAGAEAWQRVPALGGGAAGERTQERTVLPEFLLQKDLAMWLIALNVLAILASLFPWDLGKQADPLKPAPMGIHPEWYFMASFHMLKIFGNCLPGASGRGGRHGAVHYRADPLGRHSVL